MQRIVVLFPEPLGPRKPVTRPGFALNDRLSTATREPNRLVRSVTSITPLSKHTDDRPPRSSCGEPLYQL